ncbi:MAG: ribonuclease P protein component [Micrococcaceae bacterium]
MLPAPLRIRTSQEFAQVISNGVKVVEPGAIIYVCSEKEQPQAAGFIVSKAIGNAVQRNRVKRKFRAIVAENLAENQRVVIRARPLARKFSFQDLQQQYLHAIKIAQQKAQKC